MATAAGGSRPTPAVHREDDIERATKRARTGAESASATATAGDAQEPLTVILFYKYATLDAPAEQAKAKELCTRLGLTGRVLIGTEGINGTLCGKKDAIRQYIRTMVKDDRFADIDWKTSTSVDDPFPDLFIKDVKEIINTGGVIPPKFDNGGKHLAPAEFHEMAAKAAAGDSEYVLLDVRNVKEYSIGHFERAMRCEMKFFSQYPKFVDNNIDKFKGKKVLMYCTGGIRCEKASVYMKSKGVKDVYQLKGGIHRYMEAFPDGGFFKGKNFVFDKRVAMASNDGQIVGRCEYCDKPYDELHGTRVCTVCRELVLICAPCRGKVTELHCEQHFHLKDLYFTNLERFSVAELRAQHAGLKKLHADLVAGGKKERNRRRTLQRQMAKLEHRIANLVTQQRAEASSKAAEPAAAATAGKQPQGSADVAASAGAGGGAGAEAGAGGSAGASAGAPAKATAKATSAAAASSTTAEDGAGVPCRTCGHAGCEGACWGFWRASGAGQLDYDAPASKAAAADVEALKEQQQRSS